MAALERQLVSVHAESFAAAERTVLPPPEPVDPGPIEAELSESAGVPALSETTGGGDDAPIAPDPEPVDRYELMREFRKSGRRGLPFWRLRDQIDAARIADFEAEEAAGIEVVRRETSGKLAGQLSAVSGRSMRVSKVDRPHGRVKEAERQPKALLGDG